MGNSEIYLDKYKHLEEAVRTVYRIKESDSISYFLSVQPKYKHLADKIRYCQKVRNLLVHEVKIEDEFTVTPSDAMIRFIDRLIARIINLPRCYDIQVKIGDVYWRGLSDSVKEAVLVMKNRMFTHIPILDDRGVVIGVFDENSVFSYIADQEIVSIDEELRFSDIEKYISLDGRETETFVFVRGDSYVDDLEDTVEEAYSKGERVGIAFVTPNGRRDERIQGIITPFDIIKASDND